MMVTTDATFANGLNILHESRCASANYTIDPSYLDTTIPVLVQETSVSLSRLSELELGRGLRRGVVEGRNAGFRDIHVLLDRATTDADCAHDLTVLLERVAPAEDHHPSLVSVLETVQGVARL